MQIEPHAWLITLPLTFALIQLQLLPQDHGVKRLWRTLLETESLGWQRIGFAPAPNELFNRPWLRRVIFSMIVTGLLIASLVSLAAFAGFAPAV